MRDGTGCNYLYGKAAPSMLRLTNHCAMPPGRGLDRLGFDVALNQHTGADVTGIESHGQADEHASAGQERS